MKVTVCFGDIRVVVPCGSGDLTIRELQEKACARYRKAISKGPNYYVHINQLESSIDGGILDADDCVCDVVEDREKLTAIFEEEVSFNQEYMAGNILFNSKTLSPRASLTNQSKCAGDFEQRHSTSQNGKSAQVLDKKETSLEIDVNSEALRSNTRVMVRKENGLSPQNEYQNTKPPTQNHPVSLNGGIYDPRSHTSFSYKLPLKPQASNESNRSGSRNSSGRKSNSKDQNSFFRRDLALRQSMGSSLSETLDDLPLTYSIPIDDQFPLPNVNKQGSKRSFSSRNLDLSNLPWFYRDSQEVTIINEGNIAAIKVGSFIDRQSGKFAGLQVQSIDQNSRIATDDLLMPGDVIAEINEHMLMDFAFEDAEAMLIESLKYPHIQFRILPVEERERRTSLGSSSSSTTLPPAMVSSNPLTPSKSTSKPRQIDSPYNTPASLFSNQSQSPPTKPTLTQLAADNVSKYTKKIGRKLNIQLMKDIQGLGFTLTSRDTTIGGPGPIYIKQILPSGAAIKNGKLLPGDRLLDVNGKSVIGKSQEEVVATLRAISIGSTVNITISRQNEEMPRKIKDDPDADKMVNDGHLIEHFVFEIPLNDTGSAGLGIRLKGNQNRKTGEDMGIYVRAVIRGGAAWQDGRLQPNDQLLEVNGHSLRGMPNPAAIDVLTNSMVTEGNMRGMIEMVIARRRRSSDEAASQVSSEASGDMSDIIIDHFSAERAAEVKHEPASETDGVPLDSIKNPDVVLYDDEEELMDAGYEPFSRESTLRQSISEKRKDPVPRLPNQNDSTKRGKKEKTAENPDSAKEVIKINGTVTSPSRHSKLSSLQHHKNNSNNSGLYSWKVPQHRRIRKSASSDSLLEAVKSDTVQNEKNPPTVFEDLTAVDVGPSLGIAKSSSLESLQTAMEKYKNQPELPMPRPLTKVVRGRVLNDSFRAALNQPNDVKQEVPQLETVREIEALQHSNDASKSSKKRTKIFGIFKGHKPKRAEDDIPNKLSGSELHKLNLEAKREKDIERMTAENERISAKAKEFRQKQSSAHHKAKTKKHESSHITPVPSTYSQKVDNFYSEAKNPDPYSHHSNRTTSTSSAERHSRHKSDTSKLDEGGPIPPPVPKHHKRNKSEKLRESTSSYSSLPRPPKCESSEVQANSIHKIANARDRNSFNKIENLAFYNRHKPSSVKKHSSDTTLIHKKNIDDKSNHLPENHVQNPAFAGVKLRDRPGRTERRGSKDLARNSTFTPSFYQREASPVVPPQSFYVVQEKKDFPGEVVVRRGVVSKKSPSQRTPPTNYRHSIFTEQPTTYQAVRRPPSTTSTPRSKNDRSNISWIQSTPKRNHESGSTPDNNRSMSTPDSEVAERNRRACKMMMHFSSNIDEFLDDIETTIPYHL